MDFAYNLYRKLSDKNDGNIFMSPFSISNVLAMALLGSRENTAEELKKCLKLRNDLDAHKENLNALEKLRQSESVTFETASKLFPEKSFSVDAQFMKHCFNYYQAAVETLDFKNKSDDSTKIINAWVKQETKGKIDNLLPSGSIDVNSKLVIANAIYFKGSWLDKFDKKMTNESDFFVNENVTEKVLMMAREGEYKNYFDAELGIHAVELPYSNKDFSLVLIVPTEKFGLSKVEKALTAEKFQDLFKHMNSSKVYLGLPKMKMEHDLNLVATLKDMGVQDLFDPQKANLQGISNNTVEKLYASGIHHKAVFEVNEEGSEAAAATGLMIGFLCMPPTIICDRPFMFVVRHVPTSSVLFLGRFVSP